MSPICRLQMLMLYGLSRPLSRAEYTQVVTGLLQLSAEDAGEYLVLVSEELLRQAARAAAIKEEEEVSANMRSNDLLNSLGFPKLYVVPSSSKLPKK
jgi:hypothetical protein